MFSGQEMELLNKAIFEQEGVICIRGVLTEAEIRELREAVDHQCANVGSTSSGYDLEALSGQLWAGEPGARAGQADRIDLSLMADLIRSDASARPLLDEVSSPGGAFLYDAGGWRDYIGIRRAAFDSKLPRIAAKLLGAKVVRFWEDATFVKRPNTQQRTAFHQDHSFFQIEGDQCLVVWIPLDKADLNNGVPQYVRGSHKWGQRYAPNTLVTQTTLPGSLDPKCPDIESNPEAYDLVDFSVEPGDVIIHHVLTIHGAGGNLSQTDRRAISFRYCGDKVRYFDRPGSVPQASVLEPPKDGEPLNSNDFPVVHPKPWRGLQLADIYDQQRNSIEFDKVECETM